MIDDVHVLNRDIFMGLIDPVHSSLDDNMKDVDNLLIYLMVKFE